MKKMLLTAACLFVASQASAATLSGLYMDFYDASGAYAGYSTQVTGTLDTAAASGQTINSVTDFFGAPWAAHEVWVSGTTGSKITYSNATSGVGASYNSNTVPTFNYTFTMAAGNTAFGLLFDWGGNYNIPVLSVMHDDGGGNYSPVVQTWYNGTKTAAKTGMQTAPFPGQDPRFGAAAVPEPASMLLIGSGLAGLLGVARRRK